MTTPGDNNNGSPSEITACRSTFSQVKSEARQHLIEQGMNLDLPDSDISTGS